MQTNTKARLLLITPLLGFVILVFVLALGFGLAKHQVHPSALLDKPFPDFESSSLLDEKTVTQEALIGAFRLVNVWASWCIACIEEHDLLLELTRSESISIVGINYKDSVDEAKIWLFERGNPYQEVIVDPEGELAIDLGVYGAPESFLVDPDGMIRAKHVGALTQRVWEQEFQPLLAQFEQN